MHDIEALEKAWRRYHLKRRILPAIIGATTLLSIAAAILFVKTDTPASSTQKKALPVTHQKEQPVKKSLSPQTPKTVKNESGTSVPTPAPTPHHTAPVEKIAQNTVERPESNPTIEPDMDFLQRLDKTTKKERIAKTKPVNTSVKKSPAKKKRSPSQTVTAQPQKAETPKITVSAKKESGKSGLVITSKKTNNTLSTLIHRFNQTKDPKLATYIAQSFYKKGNYNETIRWSIIANSIEPGNETSWLLFAKAKMALKQKEDAVNALRTYLNQYSSKKIRAYLELIEASAW